MKLNIITNLTIIAAFGLLTTACHADALDDLLRELEQAELKPAAKKAPAPPKSAAKKKSAHSKKSAPAKSQQKQKSAPQPPVSKKRSAPVKKQHATTFTSTNKREQRIMSLFKTKIVPISESLFKLADSKETQQLVETSKKKRAEREKAATAKAGRGTSSRPRYQSAGGGGGRGGYSGGKGYDGGGYGGSWGSKGGGWTPSSSSSSASSPWGSSTPSRPSEATTSKLGASDAKTPAAATDTSGNYGSRGATEKEKETDEAKQTKDIQTKTTNIRNLLNRLTSQIQSATDKSAEFGKTKTKKAIEKLVEYVNTRNTALKDRPDTEWETLKTQEGALWKAFFALDPKDNDYRAAQEVATLITNLAEQLKAQNLLHPGVVPPPPPPPAAPVRAQLNELKSTLSKLALQGATQPNLSEMRTRLNNLLTTGTAQLQAGAPADPTAELTAIKPYADTHIRKAVADFLDSTP